MKNNRLAQTLSLIVLLASVHSISAQIKFLPYIDIGKHNASEGIFVKNAFRSSYQYKKYIVESGVQFDLVSNNPNLLTGLDLIGSKEFLIRDMPITIKGFFMMNRFSDIMYETNWGARIETKKFENFIFELGTNNKTYTINSSARAKYNIKKSTSKHYENFTLIYMVAGYLKPHQNPWNIGLSITNVDFYNINQSTNPVFNLKMVCNMKSNITLYMDTWYKQAGIFNINANYFGYFFRGGIQWEI